MKSLFVLIIAASSLSLMSCEDKRINEISEKVQRLEKENSELKSRVDSLSKLSVPFMLFQAAVMSEMQKSPQESIEAYEVILEYTDSFWAHEAKTRIKNIEERSKYWSKEKGWQLPSGEEEIVPELGVVSCPGC